MKDFAGIKAELQKLEQSSERQFTNLHNGVQLLEDWQAKVEATTSAAIETNSVQKETTANTDRASVKDEQTEATLAAFELKIQNHEAQMQGHNAELRQQK